MVQLIISAGQISARKARRGKGKPRAGCIAQPRWAALEPQRGTNFSRGLRCAESPRPLVFTVATRKKCFWNRNVKVSKSTVRKGKKQKLRITQQQHFQKHTGNLGA